MDSNHLFDVPQATLLTSGGARFPVRRIYCIGRNYADHAREMGADPKTEPPFFFQKPTDAAVAIPADAVADHAYAPLTRDYHHEIELVAALHSGGRDIPIETALSHVYGYGVGLDMTRRDRQQEMKDQRKPWEIAKSFDQSAPIGPIVAAAAFGAPDRGSIELSVNGVVRQAGDLADMIWSVAAQIATLSKGSALCAGDIIMTGTPAGIGPVEVGDLLTGRIDRLPVLRLRIV